MFRECYFEYAGVSSENYDLRLAYVSDNNETFSSGGEYEIKTEALPKTSEQILYGLSYSEKPLEFDIEILSTEKAIPLDQVIEIKNWLFGQDGWKKFKTLDERQDYHLKCLLIPQEDIVDGLGVRGFRCKLKNISPFWYGEDEVITLTNEYLLDLARRHEVQYTGADYTDIYQWSHFEINVLQPHMANVNYILPRIRVSSIAREGFDDEEVPCFDIGVSKYQTADELVNAYKTGINTSWSADVPSYNGSDIESSIRVETSFEQSSNKLSLGDNFILDTQYINCIVESKPDLFIATYIGRRPFNLKPGKNICYVLNPENISKIEISYTPKYRIGAF